MILFIRKEENMTKYTTGLTSTLSPNDKLFRTHRFFFFEVDKASDTDIDRIDELYGDFQLDYIRHRTGGGAGSYHWISPTLILKKEWKEMIYEVKDINIKCPQTTMRVKPNKYPNEENIWYSHIIGKHAIDPLTNNSDALTNRLNFWFAEDLKGKQPTIIRFVTYKLPPQGECVHCRKLFDILSDEKEFCPDCLIDFKLDVRLT